MTRTNLLVGIKLYFYTYTKGSKEAKISMWAAFFLNSCLLELA